MALREGKDLGPFLRIVTLSALIATLAGAAPWATRTPFKALTSFETLRIPNGEKAVSRTVEFPAVDPRAGTRVVLRFQSRLQADRPGGWNYYLGIALNGRPVHGFTANGTPRLLNRGLEVTLDEGRAYTWPWWGAVPGVETSLLTFFGPGGAMLDERIKSDRNELYWHMIDVTDLVHFRKMGLDDQVIEAKPNQLTLSNGLLFGFVKNAKYELVVDDLAVGYLPVKAWQRKVGALGAGVETLKDAVALAGAGFELRVGRSGAAHVVRNGQTFALQSRFSMAGERIGENAFAAIPGERQSAAWKPDVTRPDDATIEVVAECGPYAIVRRFKLDGHRVRVSDRIRNLRDRPLGLRIRHSMDADPACPDILLSGTSETTLEQAAQNPTILLLTDKARLGVLLEDNVLRIQAAMSSRPSHAEFRTIHFGLKPNAEYTCEFTLYTYDPPADYWTFLNEVRRDWDVNYAIEGPWDFFNVQRNRHLIEDVDRLRAYLKRKRLRIVALAPWIDYENFDPDTGGLVTREKYRKLMTDAARAFRAADPTIKVTGCMESFPISLSIEDSRALWQMLGKPPQGYPLVTADMLRKLKGLNEADLDTLFVNPQGKIAVELYYRGGGPGREATPMVALAAYPVVGNRHHARLMEQARFIKESCGLDGIYIDCFSMAYSGGMAHMRFDYGKWDGHTVDVDSDTGRVSAAYTDAGLVGAASRAALIRYCLRDGGVFVANSYPVVRETQSLRTFRFSESEYCFNPLDLQRGQKPEWFARMTGGQLSTPIGLGYRPVRLRPHDRENYARILGKAAVTYLRFGGLSYHYTAEIPAEGPGSGEYGIFNRMFPITPVELREGAMIGRERIVTAVSGAFPWQGDAEPVVSGFDLNGRPVPVKSEAKRAAHGWTVMITLEDWENVAVVE